MIWKSYGTHFAALLRRGKSGPARRMAWAIGDQALSSVTNFLLSVAVARTVGPVEFGAFSLAFAVYLVCVVIARALSTAALTIRYSGADTIAWRNATAAAAGAAVVVGLVGGVLVLVVATAIGGASGPVLQILAIGLAPLLLQDAWRYALFAVGRARAAFMTDLVWLLGFAASFGLVTMVLGEPSVGALVAAWVAGGAAGAVLGAFLCGTAPKPLRTLAWWKKHREIVTNLTAENLLVSGGLPLTLIGVTAISGLATAGALRAGQVLMNMIHVPSYGMSMFAIPEAVRLRRRSRSAVLTLSALIGAILAMLALAWGGILLLLPLDAGRALLGDTWATARDVILPLSLLTAALGVQSGAKVGLRAYALTRRSLYARFVTSALMVAGGLGGAAAGGAQGAAWGIASGVAIGTVLWWHQLLTPPTADGDAMNTHIDLGEA